MTQQSLVRDIALGAVMLVATAAAPPVRAHDPNFEYWRDYEVAFLDWCARDSATACQCVMERLETSLSFDRFARLVSDGVETMAADPGFANALASARPACAGESKLTDAKR